MKFLVLPLIVLAALAADKKPSNPRPVHYEIKGLVFEVVESGGKSAVGVMLGSTIYYCLTYEGQSVATGDYIHFIGPVFDKHANLIVLAPCQIKGHLKRR